MCKKKKEFMPPKFMSVSEAADQLLQIAKNKQGGEEIVAYDENSLFVGLARVGHDSQAIVACSLKEMKETDLGPPLHSLILPANNLHHIEKEYLQQFSKVTL
jgi:diphthine methyl ester synthase